LAPILDVVSRIYRFGHTCDIRAIFLVKALYREEIGVSIKMTSFAEVLVFIFSGLTIIIIVFTRIYEQWANRNTVAPLRVSNSAPITNVGSSAATAAGNRTISNNGTLRMSKECRMIK
jgi:hypothetical protein